MSRLFTCAVVLAVLTPAAARADVSNVTGAAAPVVVTPSTTQETQTQPTPATKPPFTQRHGFGVVAPSRVAAPHVAAPRPRLR